MALTLRTVKGSSLTFQEMDDNLSLLYTASVINATGSASPPTGSNGLYSTGSIVKLGGNLTEKTTISSSGGFSLNLGDPNQPLAGLVINAGSSSFNSPVMITGSYFVKGTTASTNNVTVQIKDNFTSSLLEIRDDGMVNIGRISGSVVTSSADLTINHWITGKDFISLWNYNTGLGMLFIEEGALGINMTDKTGPILANLHFFTGGAFGDNIRFDANEATINFAGNKGKIKATNVGGGWIRFNGVSTVFDIAGDEGSDFRIGTDGNGTDGKGIYLVAKGVGGFRQCLRLLNSSTAEPSLDLLPQGIGSATLTGSFSVTGSLFLTGSLKLTPSSSFTLPITASFFTPTTGSMFFSGSYIWVHNGVRWMSASLA